MGKKADKFSWTSALVGAASATLVTTLLHSKPKDPTFHLTRIRLKLPVVDNQLNLTVHVTNPNTTAIHYSSTTMSIFYDGSLLGSAEVEAGSQPAQSCQLLQLPARLDLRELAQHGKKFIADVAKREMVLDARVDIGGKAQVLWWEKKFNVHVESRVTVDPICLDVIGQESRAQLELFLP